MRALQYIPFTLAVFVLLVGFEALAWTHVARDGETIDSLAVKYYGDADMVMVIRAANGFVHPDDGALTDGELVEIPEARIYRFRAVDTWESLAEQFLASTKRGNFLAGMNNFKDGKTPQAGTLIKLPYHLRHIFAPKESIKSVTRMYLGNRVTTRWLRAYNFTRKKKFKRGDVLIVPLIRLDFVEEEQKRVEETRALLSTDSEVRNQAKAAKDIAEIKAAYDEGHYVRTVALAQRAIGRGGLTVPQEIGIHNYLAFTYVALGEADLAEAAFRRTIKLQPAMELSPITTSPKILEVFKRAKKAVQNGDEPDTSFDSK